MAGGHLCCLEGETEAQNLLETDEAAENPMWSVSNWTVLLSGREVLPCPGSPGLEGWGPTCFHTLGIPQL